MKEKLNIEDLSQQDRIEYYMRFNSYYPIITNSELIIFLFLITIIFIFALANLTLNGGDPSKIINMYNSIFNLIKILYIIVCVDIIKNLFFILIDSKNKKKFLKCKLKK